MGWGNTQRKRTYQCWSDMKQRCMNEKHKQFKNYGARGIFICQRWLEAFENFVEDMGEKPDGLTLDRIDNNGPYAPENCRWATPAQQRRNQRDCKYVEYNGERLTAEELGIKLGLHPTTIRYRIKNGWKLEDIVNPEIQLRGRNSKPREYAARKEQK